MSTIFFVILKKSSDSKLIFAKGSLLWASKPAEIKITSGLNLSKLLELFDQILLNKSNEKIENRFI